MIRIERYNFANTAIEFSSPGMGIIAARVEGVIDANYISVLADYADRVVPDPQPLAVFSDFSLVTGYAGFARTRLTRWVLKRRKRLRAFRLRIKPSWLARIGIALANIVLGGKVSVHRNDTEMKQLLEASVSEHPERRA